MYCESKSTVLEDLKQKGILGEYNDILDKNAFDTFNKEFTRFIELKYPDIKIPQGEYFFDDPYEVKTKLTRSSAYYRDTYSVRLFVQPNDALFDSLDKLRFDEEVKIAENDFDILKEPEAYFPPDESLDPMYMRKTFSTESLNREYSKKMRAAMLSFMKGLNIKVDEIDADAVLVPIKRRTYTDDNGNTIVKEDPLAAFDLLQKFLAIKENISDKDMAMQTANVIVSFLGKKSKLGIELWKGIDSWPKYKEVYEKYNKRKNTTEETSKEEIDYLAEEEDDVYVDTPYLEDRQAKDLIDKVYEYDPTRFNPYAHKQAILEFVAEMIVVGVDNNYFGNKKQNPDISKEYFESIGYKDKYAQNWFIKMWNRFYNWWQENIKNNKAITIYKEEELRNTVLDIVDDVYKNQYQKFIRNYYQDESGNFFDNKGKEYEQKFYNKSLQRDDYAKYIVDTLFDSPFDYKLSGSLVLRKYGKVLRSISEELHDIDGIITLEQFRSEKNSEEFLKWIQETGLPLSKKRSKRNSEKFVREMMPFLEEQSWYKNLKELFPSWNFEVAFIGKDHKKGESITISGYVEHPTETILVEGADGSGAANFFKASDNGKVLPKRYVLDFFLRTDEGKYPLVFDNYYLDWKQIFEAKINMGRGKDLTDLIYFDPFLTDRYKFTNKGFRYFTFANDKFTSMSDPADSKIDEATIKNARAREAADALGNRLAEGLGVRYMNITAEQARQIHESSKKKYNGEPAFYFGGTVYIVGDNVNFDTVLHEMSHPLLRAIYRENPTLFNNLYDSLMATLEGKRIKEHVEMNYPELDENNFLFKEEALAYALQTRAANKVTEQIESEGFESFIRKMLDSLRNLLKRIFKVSVAKIDVDTSIDELADMLLEKSFKYETPNITNDDVFAYAREIKAMADSLTKNLKADQIQNSLNDLYATNQLVYDKAKNFRTRSPLYQKMLREALFIKGTKELTPRVKKSLSGYQTITNTQDLSIDEIIKNTVEAEKARTTDLTNRARSFVNSVTVVNNISQNIFNDLVKMQKSGQFDSSRDAMALLFLYRSSVRSYNDMFNTFDELLMEVEGFDVTQPNDLVDLVNETKNNLMRADKKIRDIYKENAVNFYVEITGHMNDFLKEELGKNLKNALTGKLTPTEIEELYNGAVTQTLTPEDYEELYAKYEKKGVKPEYIKKFIDDYNTFLMNQDKITDGLSGKLKDVSWFNRFFESYTSSNDPIVGGLAIFINDQRTEATNRALEKSYKFRKQLEPLLERVGYNTLKTRQLTDLLMFKDKILFIDPKTKKPVEKEVFTFLNEFGNGWRYAQDLLEYQVDEAWSTEDQEKIKEATNALRQFKRDYMHDEFIPEVYEKDNIFDKYGDLGKRAWLTRKMALDAYNNESNELSDELERFQKYSTLQELWRDYKNLYSLTYPDGTEKVDDPANDVYDLSITRILLEHRAASGDYYEFIPRAGSLQTAYNEFLSLKDQEDLTADELEKAKQDWLKQNLRVAYTQEFYDSRKELTTKLRELQSKIVKVMGEEFDMSNAFDQIYNLMYAYKDEQGQPVPELLGAEKMKMIKKLNQEIIDYKAKFDTKTGLSRDEAEELDLYIALTKKGSDKLNDEQKLRYRQLLEKQAKSGLSIGEVALMQNIYAELSSLTRKTPTEYYIDSLNEHLQRLEVATVTEDEVDAFINGQEMRNLLSTDGKLVDWFRDNHVSRKVKNNKTRKLELRYERTMANSISIPKNEKYYEKTTLLNELTGEEETFNGLPNARHSQYRVKDKYRTGYNSKTGEVELEVGVHIDNKGQYLPRLFTNVNDPNSAKDDKYINKDYMRLKEQTTSARFQLLKLMKDAHLEFQEDKSNKSKLYLDMPRYVLRDSLTRIQSGEISERYNQIKKGVGQYLRDSWGKSVDEGEREHNYERDNNLEEYRLVNTDLNSEEISYIPVSGLYNINIDNTDPDVVRGMFKYLLSLEQQSQLLQTLPLVQSILDTLEDPANAPKSPNTYSKTLNRIKGKLIHTTRPGASNNRAGQVRSLMEREYYGKQYSGEGSSVYLDKFIGQMQKLSARASLAVNIPSDLKNRYGQIVQNMIESAGGEFITVKDLAKARLWAATTMLEWSAKSVYSKGTPALSSQLIEMFDSAFKVEDDFGRSVSRNFAKDMMNGEWMYNIRKNLEMEASLQLFGAFLNAQKVEQKLSNGKTIMLNYKDAWQINKDTGIAELKPGVDPAWSNKTIYHDYVKGQTLEDIAKMYGVTVEELQQRNKVVDAIEFEDGQEIIIAKSEKFKLFRNKFQGVSHRLYGSYDKFAQSEGNLYLPYRMFTFMRKWFIPMFTNRFGTSVEIQDGKWYKPKFNKRYDWMTTKTTIGFYINAFLGMKELIKSKGKYWSYMPADQKADLMRTLTESLFIITMALLASMLWGYDPDDPDRFKKMRERSGAFGTDEFKTWGFIQNHALLLLLGAQAETSAFIPLPTMFGVNFGADDYMKMATTTTSAFGNTISLYVKIFEDIFKVITFNEKAYYQTDQGAYLWQKEGSPKVIGHLLKTVGINGNTGQVDIALEGLESAGRLK